MNDPLADAIAQLAEPDRGELSAMAGRTGSVAQRAFAARHLKAGDTTLARIVLAFPASDFRDMDIRMANAFLAGVAVFRLRDG